MVWNSDPGVIRLNSLSPLDSRLCAKKRVESVFDSSGFAVEAFTTRFESLFSQCLVRTLVLQSSMYLFCSISHQFLKFLLLAGRIFDFRAGL